MTRPMELSAAATSIERSEQCADRCIDRWRSDLDVDDCAPGVGSNFRAELCAASWQDLHASDRQATQRYVVVTANSGGAAWTPDEGTTWYVLPGVSGCWAVAFATPGAGWLVGTGGQIIKISF